MPAQALALKREVTLAPSPAIVRRRESSFEAWDDYVDRHPHGSPFHLSAWKNVIEEVYGYTPMYLEVQRDGVIVGVLPLFLVTGLIVRKALISTPFAVYGGALADDAEAYAALGNAARELGQELEVQYVELRNRSFEQTLGFSPINRYVAFTQNIDAGEEELLEAIPRKTRRMVRKSLSENFSVHIETENYRAFEEIYSRNLRRLGTPAFPRKHFEALMRHFQGSIDIREVRLGDRLASAVLTLYYRNWVLPYYGASDPALNAHAPNNFMYFDLMRWGGRNGFRFFDFGRSKRFVAGSYDFKSHWGMVERELPYEMLLVKRKQLPNFSPANPAFKWPMRAWRRVPLSLTRAVGPMLVRLFP
jgi:FemAB-related protein (PEP-CTERM system-associated)